jgi:hypothetical protein
MIYTDFLTAEHGTRLWPWLIDNNNNNNNNSKTLMFLQYIITLENFLKRDHLGEVIVTG